LFGGGGCGAAVKYWIGADVVRRQVVRVVGAELPVIRFQIQPLKVDVCTAGAGPPAPE
jgi:hypothetical protein